MKGPPEMCEPHVNANGNPSTEGNRSFQNKSIDFTDYMWMGEEEIDDFDKKCEDEFWEEFLMQEAYDQMVAEEEERETHYYAGGRSSGSDGGHRRSGYNEPRQMPPQPQRMTDLENHMAELNVNSNNAHYQGRYNARPRMYQPHFSHQRLQQQQQQAASLHGYHHPQVSDYQQQHHHNAMAVSAASSQPHPFHQQQQPLQQQPHVIMAATNVGHNISGSNLRGLSPALAPSSRSLNPNAAVFVPGGQITPAIPVGVQHHPHSLGR